MRSGLDELLGQSTALSQDASGTTLPVSTLQPGAAQPRRVFDEASLASLADSIREQGVLQPLLVRPTGEGHEIVAGERRWRAAQLAGLTEVPVIIRELDDRQARAASLVENLQRENLNVIDEVDGKLDLVALALGLDREQARIRLTQLVSEEPGEEHAVLTALFIPLGEAWGTFTKNKLRVLNWPSAVVEALRGGLPFTHASVIVSVPEEHHARLLQLSQGGASRTELQAEVARLKAAAAQAPAMPVQRALQVSKHLGSRRALARLKPADLKALERWLDKMPEGIRQALEQSET